ncbi:helix-turn-helix domain-containing protein [Nocardia sp. NPDC050175]|uniref:helix-turn-helix domain-containing protein n=1 Tax=Nocardia sp. NPDC050175 TaxID=3364317 RepID=UPI00378FE02D
MGAQNDPGLVPRERVALSGSWRLQAYVFALEPDHVQLEALKSHCGAQRFAFNWGLALVKANLAQREAERSYGIEEVEVVVRDRRPNQL